MELIKSELKEIKKLAKTMLDKDLDDEQAFEFLAMYLFFFRDEDIQKVMVDMNYSITNGPNDGGIDFVYYDDENSKVIIGQCKYSKNFTLNDVITELNKMSSTFENFKIANTGHYNSKLKKELQNALDRLPEGFEENVEYNIFTIASFDENELNNKIDNEHNVYSKDMINVFMLNDFNSKIRELTEAIKTISTFKIDIDKAKNYLTYETDRVSGIMVNMSSYSLVKMYNKYKDEGLLDMNIRKYVKNKIVDDGIKKTLDKERENFWFFNNGIIIACEDYKVDGNTVKIEEFSIVNGGQTTNRIGNYKGKNNEEFYIPCKIISINKNNPALYSKIAETTNSQKPIYPRDLKANSPEMKTLQRWLAQEDIYLEIKRGEKKKNKKYKIKNDEFGQLLLSFVHQQPGTARSGKKTIFDNSNYYNKLYKQNYEKDINKKEFIIDLIRLNGDYSLVEDDLKNGKDLTMDQKNILRNARYVIFALLGLSYIVANGDISSYDIISDTNILVTTSYTYGKFISNYKKDDYIKKLKELVILMVKVLETSYNNAVNQNAVTSVSNLFKTDKKYREGLIIDYLQAMNMGFCKDLFDSCKVIFMR